MKIYKYRPDTINSDHLCSILTDQEFYFADWRDMNDPMEGYFRYYLSDHTDDEIKKVVEGKASWGISSFSFTYQDILLWSYHANNHQGICVEIDMDCGKSDEVSLDKIIYKKRIPWLLNNKKALCAKDILTTKNNIWKHEEEVRAFCKGTEKLYKVGKITRVILGVRSKASFRDEVKDMIDTKLILVKEAKIDFKQNKIIVAD